MKNGVIFDLDGTLWDSSKQVAESWDIALNEIGHGHLFDKETFRSVMGMPMDKIAEVLFPNMDELKRQELYWTCAKKENAYLATHPGKLFADEIKTLAALKAKYHLYIVSNCQKGYIEAFLEGTGLASFFSDRACWGDNHERKAFNILAVIKRNGLDKAIYVGDTPLDEQEARAAGVPFVHASYGFGKAAAPDRSVSCFMEILAAAEVLLG